MRNKKQTSVEWIISKLPMVNDNDPYLSELIEQAKEIEKQQIVNAYKYGKYEGDLVVMSDKYYAEQYYNETFNI